MGAATTQRAALAVSTDAEGRARYPEVQLWWCRRRRARAAGCTLVALAFLSACFPRPSWPEATRETVATLDRAYTQWFDAEAATANTRADLDRLAETNRTWEQWIGRVARLLMLAEGADPKAARLAVEREIEQARRWLAVLGALGPKGGQ